MSDKYRSIPKIVDAEQFFVAVKPWPKGVVKLKNPSPDPDPKDYYSLRGLLIYDGYWVITEDNGRQYYEEPDAFEQTYERVE